MRLFGSHNKGGPTLEQVTRELEDCHGRTELLLNAVQALAYFLKGFSFDLKEIKAEDFQQQMDDMAAMLSSGESVKKTQPLFEEIKVRIIDFINLEKNYIEDREAELKNIIELLRDGLTRVMADNQEFNTKVYERNLNMENLTRLDDIRKIKDALKSEVSKMKRIIQEKQVKDEKRLETLTHEVDVLKSDLEKAKDASLRDALTGAFNRLAFDTSIKRLFERNEIAWEPFSLLMADLDDFKAINDQYGHKVGDRVLMAFVQECKGLFRRDDFISRYGGEEFVVILPKANLRDAMKRARVLCKTLAGKPYLIDPNVPDQSVRFTVSIGVSSVRKKDTVENLIERADKALYRAKQSGKNQAAGER